MKRRTLLKAAAATPAVLAGCGESKPPPVPVPGEAIRKAIEKRTPFGTITVTGYIVREGWDQDA